MARSLLTSAKHGAYVAIALYLTMVLWVSLAASPSLDRTQNPPQQARGSETLSAQPHGAAGL
ncbi:hypothetical protein [Pseudomonas sp. Fl4BN1]|uniref:hypothetical protein n=1 Tax=Pseudomonas sp. Fl4BN1 TaxID=2697651 RepID=UPI0013789B7F|nr:hypothetical protein [Pseudomonas sp. Fl4BN1]NBF12420.1 hypothetical protein [Pseudomonas sp. Fl4BN1]